MCAVASTEFVRSVSPPKFFGIDIDGTFHSFDDQCFEKNRLAFRKLVEAGYSPFCCTGKQTRHEIRKNTGRPTIAVYELLQELYTEGIYRCHPGVYQNGASVYNARGDLISSTRFSDEFLKDVCEIAERRGCMDNVIFETPSDCYVLSLNEELWKAVVCALHISVHLTVATPEEICRKNITHVLVYKFADMQPHLKGIPGVHYVARPGSMELTDVNPPGVSKATGIAELMKHHGLEAKDCAFIGDGLNDIEAMEAAECSFAVGNAPDHVKRHAKYVVKETNEEGAFHKVVSLVYGINVD